MMDAKKPGRAKSLINGHWQSIIRVSHITGWLAAAFFCGMSLTGWVHTENDDIHEDSSGRREMIEREMSPITALLQSESSRINELKSTQSVMIERVANMDKVLSEIKSTQQQILRELKQK